MGKIQSENRIVSQLSPKRHELFEPAFEYVQHKILPVQLSSVFSYRAHDFIPKMQGGDASPVKIDKDKFRLESSHEDKGVVKMARLWLLEQLRGEQ